jgi:integrase
MRHRVTPLTALAVRNEKPRAVRTELPDPGCNGLYLVIQPTGSKSWAVRYRVGDKPRKLTLGSTIVLGSGDTEPAHPKIGDPLTLSAARRLATEQLHKVRQGIDPARTQREVERPALAVATFEAVAAHYLKREGKALRTAEWRRSALERLVFPAFGAKPIDSIRRSDVIALLDEIQDQRGPVMADRALAVVRRIMNWHASRTDDFRSPIVRGMARTKPRERARERILTDDELRAVWRTAESSDAPFGRFCQLILLTGARRTEAAAMTWTEISDCDWVLPAGRNKTKVELVRPLSEPARLVLVTVKAGAGDKKPGFVFSSDGGARPLGGFSKSKRAFDTACGVEGWTLHDLRRSARSLMSRGGVPSDHAERCLGHVIGGVRATYDRHEYHTEKKRAFDALANQIDRILKPQPNVAQLRPNAGGGA